MILVCDFLHDMSQICSRIFANVDKMLYFTRLAEANFAEWWGQEGVLSEQFGTVCDL